jgi:hypothetical protein
MKYVEFFFYTFAWLGAMFGIDTNLILGFIAIGLMWKCIGEIK